MNEAPGSSSTRVRAARRARLSERRRRRNHRIAIGLGVLLGVAVVGAGASVAWRTLGRAASGADPSRAGRASASPTSAAEATGVPVSSSTGATASVEPTTPLGPPAPAGPATITVAAVGDMLFDRRVGAYIRTAGGAAPLAAVATRLAAADVTVGNLESVLGTTGKPVANKEYTFRGPLSAIAGLKRAGFDAVSLANNHALDYGKDPLVETVAALDKAGIGHAGAGENTQAAWRPATITRPRAKVAYLAYTHTLPPGFMAGPDKWGVAFGRADMGLMDAAIKKARKTHDYVIVTFHWGTELEDNANASQVKWAHRAIDSGADMVIGHHPHVIQGVEFYKGRLIAYSLGDFVWDHSRPKSGESFILEAKLGPSGVSDVVAVPVYMQQSTGKPEYASPAMAKTILTRLQKISQRHGTRVFIEGDQARLLP